MIPTSASRWSRLEGRGLIVVRSGDIGKYDQVIRTDYTRDTPPYLSLLSSDSLQFRAPTNEKWYTSTVDISTHMCGRELWPMYSKFLMQRARSAYVECALLFDLNVVKFSVMMIRMRAVMKAGEGSQMMSLAPFVVLVLIQVILTIQVLVVTWLVVQAGRIRRRS